MLTVALAGCNSSSSPSSASPVAGGDWTDVPFSAGNFSTNDAGSITPTTVPYVYRYAIVGHTMLFQGSAQIGVNNDTTNEIRFAIPDGYTARAYDPISGMDFDQARTGAVWNGGGTAGSAIAVIDTRHNVISVQRWDGVPAAPFPHTTCFVGFSIEIPLN
jgi:hypothetical protein